MSTRLSSVGAAPARYQLGWASATCELVASAWKENFRAAAVSSPDAKGAAHEPPAGEAEQGEAGPGPAPPQKRQRTDPVLECFEAESARVPIQFVYMMLGTSFSVTGDTTADVAMLRKLPCSV